MRFRHPRNLDGLSIYLSVICHAYRSIWIGYICRCRIGRLAWLLSVWHLNASRWRLIVSIHTICLTCKSCCEMRESLEVFLVYLVNRDQAIADVLASNPQLLVTAFQEQFCGMTFTPVTLQELDETRSSMISLIHSWLLERHKEFLPGFKCGEPN